MIDLFLIVPAHYFVIYHGKFSCYFMWSCVRFMEFLRQARLFSIVIQSLLLQNCAVLLLIILVKLPVCLIYRIIGQF